MLANNAYFGAPPRLRFRICRTTNYTLIKDVAVIQRGYTWELIAIASFGVNHRKVAKSGELYRRKKDCIAAIQTVQLHSEFAKVIDTTVKKKKA